MRNIGFIGMGNMGGAMAKGFIEFSGVDHRRIYAYTPSFDKLLKTSESIGFRPCRSLTELAEVTDMFVMACKPHQIEGVLAGLGSDLDGKSILSIAAGWCFDDYAKVIDIEKVRVQCIMPNTPVAIGQGVLLVERKNNLTEKEREEVLSLLGGVGKTVELDTHLMGPGMAISGCGPAFVDMFIEALADGGVKNGLRREDAIDIICQMVAGSANLVTETGLNPEELKDRVCSPGGTTIKGVAALEENGFRNSVIKAVDATLK